MHFSQPVLGILDDDDAVDYDDSDDDYDNGDDEDHSHITYQYILLGLC